MSTHEPATPADDPGHDPDPALDNHPSQAEGEDPDAEPTGGGSGQTGHPSQAEGEA